jgi:4'-phosphopantetheinyl transferase
LNAAELQRAQKYHFEKDSNQFIICRSLLKFILAQHTGLDIDKINIELNSNKKPYLSSNKAICFNVSHSHDFAIIAMSKRAVGIDIEYLNTNFHFSEVLPSVFGNLEIESILNTDDKTYAFYKFWTRKEAIVKATGQGISDHLTQIPAMDGHHTVSSTLLDGFKNLHILSFDLCEDYVASIALCDESPNFNKLLCYNLPNSIAGLVLFCNLKN